MHAATAVYDRAADALRRVFDSRIAGPPVLPMERYFPAAEGFVAAWTAIRDEALAVLEPLAAEGRFRFHEIAD